MAAITVIYSLNKMPPSISHHPTISQPPTKTGPQNITKPSPRHGDHPSPQSPAHHVFHPLHNPQIPKPHLSFGTTLARLTRPMTSDVLLFPAPLHIGLDLVGWLGRLAASETADLRCCGGAGMGWVAGFGSALCRFGEGAWRAGLQRARVGVCRRHGFEGFG
ncbi:hypothetical protein BU26DRAFT_66524 [Trematosphaeria pertusa]|uniref:Uncharacterized protein n=1 Tax=Trematosphaeria pertusa TaxID=390896 RepID=A0A6A6I437_9PLEO|nr:uncharacterized protein BU26DRAFT_66524 [Trematosphaeria pertusa]KAF2245264.1 hypothetical protein BU26DRAFT_66524 [Trematosphaeria pertusa]